MDTQREKSCLIVDYDQHILADVEFVASSRRSDMIAQWKSGKAVFPAQSAQMLKSVNIYVKIGFEGKLEILCPSPKIFYFLIWNYTLLK